MFEHFIQSHFDRTPVGIALNQLENKFRKHSPILNDDYYHRPYSALRLAKESGLFGQSALMSCQDFAFTICPDSSAGSEIKTLFWNKQHSSAIQTLRLPRTLTMKLYPTYFTAISDGRKPYEGRAWDPSSDKDYADIRHGDSIVFTLDNQSPNFESNCHYYGLPSCASMHVTVDEIYFAPTVHSMFCLGIPAGLEFQPDVRHTTAELLELGRAAVYYSLPNYPDRIDQHGFLGIKISHARRID